MDNATREALLGSIEKWKRIVAGTGEDYGAINCPLCTMFLTTKRCRGCPVCETTGQPGCIKSPYVDYMRYQYSNPSILIPRDCKRQPRPNSPSCKACCRRSPGMTPDSITDAVFAAKAFLRAAERLAAMIGSANIRYLAPNTPARSGGRRWI